MFGSVYSTVVDPLLADVRSFVPGFAGLNAGDRVLDVCCGTGKQVLVYGEAGMEAVGIDMDPDMLRVAVAARTELRLSAISFVLGDATAMPFRTGDFDAASVSFGLHDKNSRARNITVLEMKRVVRPGGTLVFVDFHVPLPGNIWGYLARSIERLVGGEHYRGFQHYRASGGMVRVLREHGLRETRNFIWPNGLIECVTARNE